MAEKTKPVDEKAVMLTIRISPERKKQIRQWMLDHNIEKIQQFVQDAIALALGETKRPKNVAKKDETFDAEPVYNLHNPEYRDWINFVIDVFNSGNQEDIDGLISNIRNFKLGPEVSKLAAIVADLLQVLKKQEVSPDASITAAFAETTDLARTLTRARDNLKHIQAREKTTGQTGTKRTG